MVDAGSRLSRNVICRRMRGVAAGHCCMGGGVKGQTRLGPRRLAVKSPSGGELTTYRWPSKTNNSFLVSFITFSQR